MKWILLTAIVLLAGCSEKVLMRDCERVRGNFWSCLDP
jgi:hypothetical protein